MDEDKQKVKYWRRKVKVVDDAAWEGHITFWNNYATRQFCLGETLLISNAELSWNTYRNETTLQINCWYDAMLFPCEGDCADFAF